MASAYGELTESLRRAYGKHLHIFQNHAFCSATRHSSSRLALRMTATLNSLRRLMANLTDPYGKCFAYGGLRRTLRTLTVLPTRARFKQVLCLRRLTAHLTDPYGFPNGNAFSTMVLLTAAYGAPYGPLRFSQWECVFNHGVAYGGLRRTLRTLTVLPMGMRFQYWQLTAYLTD